MLEIRPLLQGNGLAHGNALIGRPLAPALTRAQK
jgi:hypothetical protein